MPLNFDLAGKVYPSVTVKVTSDQIAAYAEAAGDANPRYRPGPDQIAPPVFAVVPALEVTGNVSGDPELAVDNPLMILHGEQEFRYHRPLRPGELVLTPTLEQVEDKGSGATIVVRVDATTPEGEPVVDQWWTIFVRGAGSGVKKPASDKPAGPVAGELAAAFTRNIAADMPSRYAPASGDHNPIHLDADVARAVGLPGVINHGLGTLAVISAGLVEALAGGDPTRLRRLQVRFTSPVFPGEDIATHVRETDQQGVFLYETHRPDGTVAATGLVEVD